MTEFTDQAAYSAARDAHVAGGGTLEAFEAENGYAATVPLAATPPQGDSERGGLSPERYAQEREAFIANGGSPDLWSSMMEGVQPTSVANGDLNVTDDDAPDASEVRATYDAMIAAGQTPEQVAEAFKAAGLDLPSLAKDNRSDEAKLHDALHPDVRLEDYNPGPVPPAPGVDFNAHAKALGELRGMLAAAQIDADVGSSMIAEMVETGRALAAASGPAQQLWLREQASLLDRLSRGNADAWTADAHALLAKADQSVVAAFQRAGVLSSASFVASLHHHAERLRARAEA